MWISMSPVSWEKVGNCLHGTYGHGDAGAVAGEGVDFDEDGGGWWLHQNFVLKRYLAALTPHTMRLKVLKIFKMSISFIYQLV